MYLTEYVTFAEVEDDDCLNVSRHRPINMYTKLPISNTYDNCANYSASANRINWNKMTDVQRNDYREEVGKLDFCKDTPVSLNYCDIDSTYNDLCNGLTECANKTIGSRPFKHYVKPYWKPELSETHREMQRWQADWCREGRPRGQEHPEYRSYKDHKKVFRRLLRAASEKHTDNLNAEIDNSLELDSNVFLKHVTKRRSAYNKNSTPPGIVFNGEVYRDQNAVTQQWKKLLGKSFPAS